MKKTLFLILFPLALCSFISPRAIKSTDSTTYSLGTKSYEGINEGKVNLLSYENWFKKEYNYEFSYYIAKIYKFSSYIDLKIKDIFVKRVPKNTSLNFTTSYETGYSESYTNLYESSYSQYKEVSAGISNKFEEGFKLGGEIISYEEGYSNTFSLSLTYGESFSEKISNSINTSRYFKTIVTESYNYENTNSFDTRFHLCYRLKFNIYEVKVQYYKPVQKKHEKGIGGADYTYSSKEITNKAQSYFLLVPTVDSIYIDESIYKMNSNGDKLNLNLRKENNIIYL